MVTFNREQFIINIKNIIGRVSNMKDKVKALQLLDKFQYNTEENYYLDFFADDELWNIYSDTLIKWMEIRDKMTQKELENYRKALPSIMDNIDWCKIQQEIFDNRLRDANNKYLNN